MKRFFLLLCLLLCTSLTQAAVVFDATASGSGIGTAVSFAHTVTSSGSNRAIFVCVAWASNTYTLSSPQYAGSAMTTVFALQAAGVVSNSCFVKVNPTTGANNFTATMSSSVNWKAGALSATAVDQTTPNGAAVTNITGGSGAITVNVSSAANELVMDSLALDLGGGEGDPAVGAGQTLNWMLKSAVVYAGASSRETGAATTTMSWTSTGRGSGTRWALGAFAIKESTASAVPTIVFTGN